MEADEFRQNGRELIDFVSKYLETIGDRRVTPNVEPGYLKDMIPQDPPLQGEPFDEIMKDIEPKIMTGMVHWQHPRFHAYFPSGASFPSILADILGDVLGVIGFSWASGPACTELEGIILDWLGKMMGLPADFLQSNEQGNGGGCLQTSASECVLVSILAARALAIQKLKRKNPEADEGVLLSKLIAYCSKEAHSCVEKGSMIAFTKLRILDTDEHFCLRGDAVAKAMEEDIKNGLVPFFVSTTVGTTSCCSVDNIAEIGPVCKKYDAWLHVDAAYAGCAQICEEFRWMFKGIEYAMSLNTNPNKWLLTNFDCSCYWVRDRFKLTQALVVDPLYLQHSFSERSIDYRHWGIPLSRRFRSLKLWFVIRVYGKEGLQNYIRNHVKLAKVFEGYVMDDDRFEIMNKVDMGLVCFRLKGSNGLSQKLLTTINASGKIHMVPASLNDKYVIRFCVCAERATEDDMKYAWNVITETAEEIGTTEDLEYVDTGHSPYHRPSIRNPGQVLPYQEKEDDMLSPLQKKAPEDILKQKRSCFVRMVSDPKLYNPKIVKVRNPSIKVQPSFPPMAANGPTGNGQQQQQNPQQQQQSSPTSSSWISWPLAFIFQDIREEDFPLRFRNWESTLSIKPGHGGGSSNRTSPEGDQKDHLKPVSPNTSRRSRSPTPKNRSKSPFPSSN